MSTHKSYKKMRCITDAIAHELGYKTEETSLVSSAGIGWRFFRWAKQFVRTKTKRRLSVAIVCSHYCNHWELAAIQSTMESLQSFISDEYEITSTLFSAKNSVEHLQDTVVSHLCHRYQEYDICLTLCSWVTVALKDQLAHLVAHLPIVFVGLPTPDKLGLVADSSCGADGIAGVVMQIPSYNQQTKTIMDLKPSLDELLIPSDTVLTHGGFTERSYGPTESFARAWRLNGGRVKIVQVTPHDNIGEVLMGSATPHSLINLSIQTSVQAQASTIIDLCNKNGVPVYAHGRQAVRQGAVFGSGGNGDAYGPYAALIISKICLEGAKPAELALPVVTEQQEVCYLERALKPQGIVVSPKTLRAMRMLPIQHVE